MEMYLNLVNILKDSSRNWNQTILYVLLMVFEPCNTFKKKKKNPKNYIGGFRADKCIRDSSVGGAVDF